MIEQRIEKELKEAMKQKDEIKVSSLRMLRSDMHNLSIQKKGQLKEEDIIKVIQKQVRQHKDAIEQFTKGKREDLAQKEKKELAILESFLPKALSQEELEKVVKDVISESGASTKKDMGNVMKEVMNRVKGRADGKTVSQVVASLLK